VARKKTTAPVDTKFKRDDKVHIDGFEISRGDIIKIVGEYGLKFKFDSVVTNTETGSVWVDCFELYRGQSHSYRSFQVDRVKRIPQKGKRGKRVVVD
jgi:hypothetical protein